MKDRSMIIVAGGSASRFGSDKLIADIQGRPLIAWTIEAIFSVVDECVLVAREDQHESLSQSFPDIVTVIGGSTRTESEIAGLAAASTSALIGIHDGARPAVPTSLVERLFEEAAIHGGAVPVLPTEGPLVTRDDLSRVHQTRRAQTPQVFWGPELRSAYRAAASTGFAGQDSADVVHNFSNLDIAVVEGDTGNIKVTVPEDLQRISQILSS